MTSSIVAVFERIGLSLLEDLLAAASGESALQMVAFTNQPAGHGASIPDARISARFSYWFEVKTARNAVREHQLREHLKSLEAAGSNERLFVVTPDATEPAVLAEISDPRVVWFSFAALSDAIDSALADPTAIVSEQATFLLRELQALLAEDGLIDNDDVVIVAARDAYTEYLRHAAYVCQPGRSFRDGLTHMGFYTRGAIQSEIPEILYREDDVTFTSDEVARRSDGSANDQRVGELIDLLLRDSPRQQGVAYQLFLLTPPGDSSTVHLVDTIVNDTVAASGRHWAWTMGQRYVSLALLTASNVRHTSDLDAP